MVRRGRIRRWLEGLEGQGGEKGEEEKVGLDMEVKSTYIWQLWRVKVVRRARSRRWGWTCRSRPPLHLGRDKKNYKRL